MTIHKFIAYSHKVLTIACRLGWLPGARYTNLRDVRRFDRLGFLDIDWKNYNFKQHLHAANLTKPLLTVAQDIEDRKDLPRILDQANELACYSNYVVVVPKDPRMEHDLEEQIPSAFLLGYSVSTRYGGTSIPPTAFKRKVHLLGGRPDVQRRLANQLTAFSLDCNRFTIDANYGDYFDGVTFRPHPTGGYEQCIIDSIKNINKLWESY